MKHRVWKAGLLVAVVTVIAGSTVFAAAGAPAPAKEQAPAAGAVPPAPAPVPAPAAPTHTELFWPDLWGKFHNPTPWLSMGLDHRFRVEYGENWDTLRDPDPARDNEYEYERYRTRWWTKWILGEDIALNTRLAWEFRTWDEPTTRTQRFDIPAGPGNPSVREFNADEALFDWLNINLRNVGGMPLTATIGRQDIIMGVGWLVLDGTPLDGSRTIYFDAARATYDWADTSSKIDLIYISQSAESDRWLEPICDENRAVTEQDENGAILYLTNTSLKPTQLEGFFMYKNDNPIDRAVTNIPTALLPRWSRKAEIFTFGGAISGTPTEHWKYRAEGAIQGGNKEDFTGVEQDMKALGVLTNLEYLFKDSHDSAAHIGYEYASGDDPGTTSSNEQFDLLWGEWPRWSELLIYTVGMETTPAELTNLHRANIGYRFNLTKKWQLTADYHALWADDPGPSVRYVISPEHRFRGDLFTAWAKFKFNDQLYGHLLGEYFIPGAYYSNPTGDDAFFLRFNVEYVF